SRCLFISSGPTHDLRSFPTRRSSDLGEKGLTCTVTLTVSPDLAVKGASGYDIMANVAPGIRFFESFPAAWAFRTNQFASSGRLRSEEHTSELQSLTNIVCRLLLEQQQ